MNPAKNNAGRNYHHLRKLHEKLAANNEKDTRPVLLYDLSLPLEIRAENKLHFESMKAAAAFLGVHRHRVARAVNARVNDKDGKQWAVREPKQNFHTHK